jgi:trehalose 6-phosphate synthase
MNFDEANWLAYRQANMQFAEVVRQQITPGAMVWVQDYHLMLMPMLLRGLIDGRNISNFTQEQLSRITEGVESEEFGSPSSAGIPGVKIGFFLHTPFPSSEIYRYASTQRFYVFFSDSPPLKDPTRPARDSLRRSVL